MVLAVCSSLTKTFLPPALFSQDSPGKHLPTTLPPNKHTVGAELSHLFILDLITSCLFSYLIVPYELFSLFKFQTDGMTGEGDAGNGRKVRQGSCTGHFFLKAS